MNLTTHATPESWLEHRRQGVTSSEIPTLLGHGYAGSNIFNLFLRKVGQPADEDPSKRWKFRCGHHMESIIHERVEEETGWSLWDPGEYTIAEHEDGLLMATVDRLRVPGHSREIVIDGWGYRIKDGKIGSEVDPVSCADAVLEFKWFDRSMSTGFQSSRVFSYALSQVTVGMMCTGLDQGAIVAAFGQMDDFVIIPVVRSAAMEEVIWERAREFWAYVEARQAPGPEYIDDSRAIGDALAAIYADEAGEEIELEPEWAETIERLAELPKEISGLQSEQQKAKNLLARRMEAATIARVPGCEKMVKYVLRSGGAENVDTRWEKRVISVVKAK